MPDTVSLFNRVAKHYDTLNTLFSFGMDSYWRKKLSESTGASKVILDIATGTAEVAIELAKSPDRTTIVGLDPSREMLVLAKEKIRSINEPRISLVEGVAESLPFTSRSFGAITIAFGIRNTVDPLVSLKEMNRVLEPGGSACILEFAIPTQRLFAPIYLLYFKNVLPTVGGIFGTKKEYRYLSESTSEFPQGKDFADLMSEAGFVNTEFTEFMMGAVILYVGTKDAK